MASSVRPVPGFLWLELAGAPASPLRSALPPSYRIDRVAGPHPGGLVRRGGGGVSLGEMAAAFDLAGGSAALDWLRSLTQGNATPVSGALQVLDAGSVEKRRMDFLDSQLTGLTLPLLSAIDGKRPFTVGLTWQPGRVVDGKGGGKLVKSPVGKRKAVTCGNFRLKGLPFDASGLARVALPSVRARLATGLSRVPSAHYAAVEVGELQLDLAARSAEPARAWVQKLLSDGQLDEAEYLDLTVELLDTALKTVLATVQLTGCGLLGSEEPRIELPNAPSDLVRLRFSVEQLDLRVVGS